MTPTELRQAAEYVRDHDGSEELSGIGVTQADFAFVGSAKVLALAWLSFVGESTRQVNPNDYRFPSKDEANEMADANEILRSMGFAGYRPSVERRP